MVPSGPPARIGGAQSVPPSLLRSSSSLLGAQSGSMPNQNAFTSLMSPRGQFNNMNMLGNVFNGSSQPNQSFGNGGPNILHASLSSQRTGMDTGAESNSMTSVGSGMGFSSPSPSFVPTNPGVSGHVQGQQFSSPSSTLSGPDQSHSQHFEPHNFQNGQQTMQQFPASHNNQQQQPQQPFQSTHGGPGSVGPVKLEPRTTADQPGEQRLMSRQQQQELQSLRNIGPVKLEPQQMQGMRGLAPVKSEPNHSESSRFHPQQQQPQQQQQQQPQQQQQQQQQQLQQMTRQSPQAAAAQMNLLHQQRLLQLQQHQQLMKVIPPQRGQFQQQFQPQNLPLRSPMKPAYEPGTCARRLTHYMSQQQHRPQDNNIEFWRKFVAEYFGPNAKKKWCVSMYGSGRQTTGVFPQDLWHCEICNRKPGRGFEATVGVLPRLFKIKYESGTLEELLYIDMPREYQNSSGQIVLHYAKAIQESVFEQLRVVRDGQLRVVFSQDLKICSWEFCARHHEELIPRRLLIPQVSQLGAAAQKYQASTQNASSNLSVPELQNNCNTFLSSARQLAKALEVPLVNELGYTKRYVRCLQISEVVNSMKDLIDYSRETGTGPMESLAKFPRRTSGSSRIQNPPHEEGQQRQHHQSMSQNTNATPGPAQATAMQVEQNNGEAGGNNLANAASTSASPSTIVGLLHQGSMNSRQQGSLGNAGSPYGVQIVSPGSSTTAIPLTQPNHSPFQTPTPSSSNIPTQNPVNQMSSVNSLPNVSLQHQALLSEADQNDSQSSVEKILQEIMSGQINGAEPMTSGMGSMGNDSKHVNGPTVHNSGLGASGFGPTGALATMNGLRSSYGNGNVRMNGRVGMGSIVQGQGMSRQPDTNNQILNGLRAVNGFNNFQYDWKPSP